MNQCYKKVTQPQPVPQTLVDSPKEKKVAATAFAGAFLTSFMLIMGVGTFTLINVKTADVEFEDLRSELGAVRCLRIARRADHIAVFVGLGTPIQHIAVLLRLDRFVDESTNAISVFSERLHKSTTMRCSPFSPTRSYEESCEDVALVFNGTDKQTYAHTRFTFQNNYIQSASYNRAQIAGLDGMFYLLRGRTYWLTSTHMCFRDSSDDDEQAQQHLSNETLPFYVDEAGITRTTIEDLRAFAPTEHTPAATASSDECRDVTHSNGIRMFPHDAANEARTWLVLDSDFLYEYGNEILDQRRRAVELGPECASKRTDVAHAHALYRIDCNISYPYGWCQHDASLPLRRLADYQLRLDIDIHGIGTLRAKETVVLANIPYLVSYSQGLQSAIGRLFIMLLTAAVVFIRGNQNASSSRYMLEHVLNTVRCRERDTRWVIEHDLMEIVVDAAITLVALFSRVIVFVFQWEVLANDGLERVLVYETIGIVASAIHFALRYGVLHLDLKREAPLTKLAGPMSICDVSAAVLLAFSDAPLLSTDSGRFAAVGRLLIGILIAISVFTRCIFGASMCALLASTVSNDTKAYKEMNGYVSVLIAATAMWMLQGIAAAGSLSALFIYPASYSIVRIMTGNVDIIRFLLFFGLTAACLPTMTKVGLRVLESECNVSLDSSMR